MSTTAHDALSPVPVIGLTGGIGSGKSTAATVFRSLGVPVVDADAISRALTGPGAEGSLAVARRFGEDFLDENRAMNRARMRELVFSNPEARRELEALLHPLIGRDVLRAFSSLSPRHALRGLRLSPASRKQDLARIRLARSRHRPRRRSLGRARRAPQRPRPRNGPFDSSESASPPRPTRRRGRRRLQRLHPRGAGGSHQTVT